MPEASSLEGMGIECKGHEETFLGDSGVSYIGLVIMCLGRF